MGQQERDESNTQLMSEPLDPSSSRTHILDKVRRNEVVVNRKDIMVEVLKSKPTKHNWAASLKREVGGDIVIWMITPRAGFDVEACWIGDSGKMRKQTIRTGRTKPLRSGSRLTLFKSGSGSRSMLTRTVTFHSSISGGAELRQQCCPSIGGFRGDMNCGATSMKGQGPRAKKTTSSIAAKTAIGETRMRSEAGRMVVTPTRTRWTEGRNTPGSVSENKQSSSSSSASKTPVLPERGVESQGKPEQHPEPVPLSESPQMVPLGSNGIPTSSATRDRIQRMGEMRSLDDRVNEKGKDHASSPGKAEAVAAAFPEAKSGGGNGMNSDEETEWVCRNCSLINKALFLQCDVCLAERPTKRSFLEEETWGGYRRAKRHRMTKTRGSESGGMATPPPSSGTTARAETPDDVHRNGGERLEVSSDGIRGSSSSSSPSLGEAGFWNTPLDSPPRADKSGSRRDAVRETKRRHFDEPSVAKTGNGVEGLGVEGLPCSMALKGKGEERGRYRQRVSDVEEEGETELVEGTEGEAFSAAFINPTSVSGALEDLPRPDSLESAPPLSSSSGESDLSAQGLQNYPATDSGLVLEDTGNMAEAGTTVIQSQGDKGKESETREEEEEEVEDEDMELDESVIDDSEQEEVEYDSSVSLDY